MASFSDDFEEEIRHQVAEQFDRTSTLVVKSGFIALIAEHVELVPRCVSRRPHSDRFRVPVANERDHAAVTVNAALFSPDGRSVAVIIGRVDRCVALRLCRRVRIAVEPVTSAMVPSDSDSDSDSGGSGSDDASGRPPVPEVDQPRRSRTPISHRYCMDPVNNIAPPA
ncbi:hypothetical protein [Mycobacterium sp. D16R24]|uniref:hypothetical protein n=1 Tax=Mycobacterium sp. D16R24 TaxID=1855656 RepID=UPI0009924231|nr:hypothetical protein [Mycobacterium sp. D16R24]